MNAKMKSILLLIAGLILCVFLGDIATTAFVKLICPLKNDSFMKYVEKGDMLLFPEKYIEENEEVKLPAILSLRGLVDDASYENKAGFIGILGCMNLQMQESNGFQMINGESDFAEGIFANVVRSTNGEADVKKDTIGLVKINDICDAPYIEELMKLLEETPDAVIQLKQYGEKDCLIVPVSLTIYNTRLEELASFSQPLESKEYQLKNAEDVFLYNEDSNFLSNGNYKLSELLQLAKRGIRKEDQLMKSNLDAADSRTVENIHEVRYGLGSYTMVDMVVSSDRNYVMSRVLTIRYIQSMLFYSGVFSLSWVLIWALVVRKIIMD